MSTTNTHRRPRKIRRTGRHTTPSQVEKVAEKATKAAPAMAIAGVLVAAPAANAATSTAIRTPVAVVQIHTTAKVAKVVSRAHTQAKVSNRSYVVQPGDSLASIAEHFYGSDNDWTWLYQANKGEISNPNSIFPGEHLVVPANGASSDAASAPATHAAKHAKTDPPAATLTSSSSAVPSGTLGCSGLEELWEDAGGSAGEATMAASIAMAESGGNQYALSPTNDYGYWQINGSWGPLATYNAIGNAKAAVHISADGTNWSPWTTYTSGAYYGRC